ncbi:hypothetical protein T07_4153 [Trichinella nelsoni]|uniref:Uncharacterized protein n=2 Tax=Trichinella TaxID=6333 RepID=A0A0V0RXY9_9BILA|nr:hypothetical protein T07_4153 [Trichinella nelsoni]
MRYSFTLRTPVQYFVVLGKSIFLHFRSISNKLKKVVSIRVEMYKCLCDHEHCLEEIRQYLAKYATINRATRFWKVPRHTNAYVSNKWHLKLPRAYLNTQESSRKWLNFGIEFFFDIIMRYSLQLPSFVQYFVVLGKSIFLHFRSISNTLKKVV